MEPSREKMVSGAFLSPAEGCWLCEAQAEAIQSRFYQHTDPHVTLKNPRNGLCLEEGHSARKFTYRLVIRNIWKHINAQNWLLYLQ